MNRIKLAHIVILLTFLVCSQADEDTDLHGNLAKRQIRSFSNEGWLEATWTSDISINNTKLFDYLDNKLGEASYQFLQDMLDETQTAENQTQTDNFKVVISLKDPEYNDQKVAIITIDTKYSMYNSTLDSWVGDNETVIVQLKYKRKVQKKLEVQLNYQLTGESVRLEVKGEWSISIKKHAPRQYPWLAWVHLIPAQILLVSAKNVLKNGLPLQHISVTAVFFSLNLILFVSLMQLSFGMLDFGGGSLKYLVVTGLFTLTSLRFAQAVLIDRMNRPRQQIWYSIFTLIYLNLLSNLATQDEFLILQSLVLVPQIIHNVINVTKARFDVSYLTCLLTGQFYLFYYKGYPDNLMRHAPNYPICGLMFGLITIQLIIIYYQSKKSSRFFLPRWMIPGYHNYHQDIVVSPNTGINIGECSICLLDLAQEPDVNVTEMNLEKGEYSVRTMITPCNHRFHIECLTNWMDRRMQCPVCRHKLPPIED